MGPWMVVIDEKSQNDDVTCSGIRFDLIDEKILRQSQSYFIKAEKRTEDLPDEYSISMSTLLHFRH